MGAGGCTNYSLSRIDSHILPTSSAISKHTIERANERNVSRTDIVNALEKPLNIRDVVIDDNGRKSQRFIGETATVNIGGCTNYSLSRIDSHILPISVTL